MISKTNNCNFRQFNNLNHKSKPAFSAHDELDTLQNGGLGRKIRYALADTSNHIQTMLNPDGTYIMDVLHYKELVESEKPTYLRPSVDERKAEVLSQIGVEINPSNIQIDNTQYPKSVRANVELQSANPEFQSVEIQGVDIENYNGGYRYVISENEKRVMPDSIRTNIIRDNIPAKGEVKFTDDSGKVRKRVFYNAYCHPAVVRERTSDNFLSSAQYQQRKRNTEALAELNIENTDQLLLDTFDERLLNESNQAANQAGQTPDEIDADLIIIKGHLEHLHSINAPSYERQKSYYLSFMPELRYYI